MSNFADKVVLITGASSGIGQATAVAFGQQGAKVVVASRQVRESEETVKQVEAAGGKAVFVQTDVSDEKQIKGLIEQAIARFGRIDIAFNNSGITGKLGAITDMTQQDWFEVINTNLTSVFFCLKHQIPQMLKQGGGVIINNASIVGNKGMPHVSMYSTTKHGVIGLTRSVALEYAQQNIRVNAIMPGVVDIPAIQAVAATPGQMDRFVAMHPVGRIASPSEIAQVVLFLASNASSFITGAAIPIDGGAIAQ
jgi:NAD(P)-dependent dehydrogenase (short-subunit alcohol dehydrogenase family)